MPAKKKKQTRRSREQYPALKPEFNLKTRYDLIDYDYIDKLSDKEKAWLNKFTEEYTNASFDKKALHKTKKLKKECYNRNNARNRCVLTRSKACGKGVNFLDLNENEETADYEDRLIEEVDKKFSKR